jgi:hypothetical protein
MPLAFQTINQGSIAFGFFNIESDMLLLQQYFFFAGDFCRYISACAGHELWNPVETFTVDEIADPEAVGDLMGAIHGIRYTGFIGDTYRKFPFPDNPADFKQNPLGFRTRDIFREMIAPCAQTIEIPFARLEGRRVRIGDYVFDRNNFHELLRYVERGGFPRWQDELRPDYVDNMKRRISESSNEMFAGLEFSSGY